MMLMAIAAIPRGGKVTISADDHTLSATAEGEGARIPEKSAAVLAGTVEAREFDARMVQVYYAMRLAEQASCTLTMTAQDQRVAILAEKIAASEAAG
jgi:hypothetical protein